MFYRNLNSLKTGIEIGASDTTILRLYKTLDPAVKPQDDYNATNDVVPIQGLTAQP
jgi:hypothetical protein